ncbi:hypothetical protein ACMGD3_13735 [Lysinibacillus sphaericus]|uniref:hypothetical protein n=1 Tax=Lysinibacillus sphaericus TaxID=1421 RepID=UPI001C5FFBAA
MKITKGIFIGITFGIVLSLVFSFVFMLFAQGLSGGVTSIYGESWLYLSTIVPFTLTFSIIAIYFVRREKPTNNKLWLLSFISALFITLYSGTIGALFGEYIVNGGLQTYSENGSVGVNVKGVLVWGIIYAFIFLPFSTPLARWFIHVFHMLLGKLNITYSN